MTDEKPFTVDSAAEYLECSPKHIRHLCATGRLAYFKLGRLIRIPYSAMRELQEEARRQVGSTKVIKRTERNDWRFPRQRKPGVTNETNQE